MQSNKGQGATQLASPPTYRPLLAQGATEYLVLLAVVLIVALVSVALLGFFPGMASDAQLTQSQTYWQSATPIAILESGAVMYNATYTDMYVRIRNTGAYPIRITKMLGNGQTVSQVWRASGSPNMSDIYYMAPGEENYFGWNNTAFFPGLPETREIVFTTASSSTSYILGGASSICTSTGVNAGTTIMNNFGFEYIEYLDNNQQITKRQIGKPLIIKCR